MKCPKCNQELKEGQLYCEACGEEIKMVPEFEPEIENSIEETLLNMADMINEVEVDDIKPYESAPKKKKKETFTVFTKEEKKSKDSFLLEEFPEEDEVFDDIVDDDDMPDEDFWDEEEIIHFKGSDNVTKAFVAFWSKSFLSKCNLVL